jgi:hypothetical protein
MTIAACFVSNEGVVLGADSTSTMCWPGSPDHHYNHEQKLFEIGEKSTIGMAMWGLGGFQRTSHRTLIAELADSFAKTPVSSVQEAAERWNGLVWPIYSTELSAEKARYDDLTRITPRAPEEDSELLRLRQRGGIGFCLAGTVPPDRTPRGFQLMYTLDQFGPQTPAPLPAGPRFWGCPNSMHRLILGFEQQSFDAVLASGKWNGTPQELFNVLQPHILHVPGGLPLREAIDFVYSSIFITIKAMKFSRLAPICGGPIEVAVITSDRKFRWVSHKGLDEAISHRPFHYRPTARELL